MYVCECVCLFCSTETQKQNPAYSYAHYAIQARSRICDIFAIKKKGKIEINFYFDRNLYTCPLVFFSFFALSNSFLESSRNVTGVCFVTRTVGL